jgi:hypothetical protein
MDPIANLQPLLDVFRRQLAENVERLQQRSKSSGEPSGQRSEESPERVEGLEAVVRRRISAFERHSPEGKVYATRTFVESVLAAEFGAHVLADPGFGRLVAEVSAALRDDPQLRERLDDLLVKL